MALWVTLVIAPLRALIGDMYDLNTLKHQPAEIAATEGRWENRPDEPTPLLLFGWPDMKQRRTHYGLKTPALGSLILTHSLDKQVPALREFPKEGRPNSTMVLWSLRIMVRLGMLMVLLDTFVLWLRCKQRLFASRPFLCFALWMDPSGLVTILTGWVIIGIDRQPWVVYGLQCIADVASTHGGLHVGISLLSFFVAYSSVFGAGYGRTTCLIRKEPQKDDPIIPSTGTPVRPLPAAVLDS